ncbi:M50 family metallopeptidase [Candidatus Woesearchaeota archaeon]|nr:M50 family metallopeptidase [Candidatus Woesearchaeota archaeon]
MLFAIQEVLDIILMTLVVGFIFKDLFRNLKNPFLFACLATAPALILHELGHKFIALAFGLAATFHAAYFWLVLGVVLKLVNFGFIFFVPAYVSITGTASAQANASIAAAGPFTNLALAGIAVLLLRQKKLTTKTYLFLSVTKQVNLFLFIFNMLPIPGFDGLKVYTSLISYFLS